MRGTVTYLLVLTMLVLTACPSRSIQRAKEASSKLATYANSGVNLTRELYRAKFISLQSKDRIADAFLTLAKAGMAFDAAVASAERTYGTSAPSDVIAGLFATFNREVVAKFIDVLQSLKLVPAVGSYADTIELLKAAILTVARAFGKGNAVSSEIAAAGG